MGNIRCYLRWPLENVWEMDRETYKGAAVKVLRFPAIGRSTSRRCKIDIIFFAGPPHLTAIWNLFYATVGLTPQFSQFS